MIKLFEYKKKIIIYQNIDSSKQKYEFPIVRRKCE